ncbi:S8 family serine peptidase, partial [Sulfurovum sp. bin170]|uniref:S8 family serine peptidase n=1 Tax=Sulfurovum sp. bin170 TaxID=2695268 RepID=UPI0013DF9C42
MKSNIFKTILSMLIVISMVGCNSNKSDTKTTYNVPVQDELPAVVSVEALDKKSHDLSYQKESNPDLDAIKSQDNLLQFMYYTANTKTAEEKSRWYISQINGFYQGMVLSLGPVETINGVVKAGWKEVGQNVATISITDEQITVGNIANNPSFNYKDWGLGVDRYDPKIQEDIELIRNTTVDVKWWFFKASNNSWYIINSTGSSIYKFGTASGQYNWQKIDTTGETLEFFIDGDTKKFKVLPENIAPILSASTATVEENATVATKIGTLTISSIGNSAITGIALSGTGESNFEVSNDGNITVKSGASLNYETTTTYSLTAVATNGAGDSNSVAVTITVTNVVDMVPVLATPTGSSISENVAIGTNVVTVQTNGVNSDENLTDSFTIVSGNTNSDFAISNSGVITTAKVLDHNTTASYTLVVKATNSAGDSTTVNVAITVPNTPNDSDNDHIPDAIEILLDMNSTNSDEDGDGVLDGLQLTGTHGDTFFDKQWHIRSLGTLVNGSGVSTIVGNDLDLLDIYHRYMGYNGGNPIIVQIVDDGVDADHEDLVDNMDLSRSYTHNGSSNTVGDPSPLTLDDTHGTMVAGIMSARAFNGKGVRGIAPFAKIAGSNWIGGEQWSSGLDKVWLSGNGANEIAVSNNSWGTYITNNTFYESILEQGTSTLRDGKGRVYVIAAGNDRENYGNSNISYISNNRYAVAVGALKNDNTHASYSSPGGNVIISGYSGDYYQNSPTIATTTVEGQSVNTGDINEKTTWSEDTNQNYTFAMNGTSAASPTVSGAIALVLEACPNLTWRDVKYLLAKHGKRIDSTNSSWVENSTGLWHSSDYGYGLVNPKGMIENCEGNYTNLGTIRTSEVTETINHD